MVFKESKLILELDDFIELKEFYRSDDNSIVKVFLNEYLFLDFSKQQIQ